MQRAEFPLQCLELGSEVVGEEFELGPLCLGFHGAHPAAMTAEAPKPLAVVQQVLAEADEVLSQGLVALKLDEVCSKLCIHSDTNLAHGCDRDASPRVQVAEVQQEA